MVSLGVTVKEKREIKKLVLSIVGAGLLALASAISAEATSVFLGPTTYTSFVDSPFNGTTFSQFYLENFEDGLLNVPGVTAVNNNPGRTLSVLANLPWFDSVDGDDGSIDGSGSSGHSLSDTNNGHVGNLGYSFVFDKAVLGELPTHAGIVWTDGAVGSFHLLVQFEAFDSSGLSLGAISSYIGDEYFYGQTSEDQFFGVISDTGISKFITRQIGSENNLEVDHLQYGNAAPVPEPATMLLMGTGLAGLVGARRKKKQ